MASKNQAILSILIIILSSVWINEAGSAERPLNCYVCEAATLGYLPKGPELQVWNFLGVVQSAHYLYLLNGITY